MLNEGFSVLFFEVANETHFVIFTEINRYRWLFFRLFISKYFWLNKKRCLKMIVT